MSQGFGDVPSTPSLKCALVLFKQGGNCIGSLDSGAGWMVAGCGCWLQAARLKIALVVDACVQTAT